LTQSQYAVNVGDGLRGGTYYWRVQATNGSDSALSPIRVFHIDLTPPEPFDLSYPPAGSRHSDRRTAFAWRASKDFAPISYRLEYSLSPFLPGSSGAVLSVPGLSTTTHILAQELERGATWYWRVVAVDQAGQERSALPRSFYLVNDLSYNLEVDTEDGFQAPLTVDRSSLTFSRYTLTPGEALPTAGIHYWRVKLYDDGGSELLTSATLSRPPRRRT
jgi:hypothetical protein